MSQIVEQKISDFMAQVEAKNPNEPEFIQAVREFRKLLFLLLQSKKDMMVKIYCLELLSPKDQLLFVFLG